MHTFWKQSTAGALLVGQLLFAGAESTGETGHSNSHKSARADDELEEKKSETYHSVAIADRKIDYMATAATFTLKDEKGEAKASIFFVSYVADVDDDCRPLTFAFNGGPGSSSVWLHLGALGPRRIDIDGAAEPPAPPYRLTNNEFTILDSTDLVFVDPVSTGFSRPAFTDKRKQFHGVEADIESVGEFIRLFVTRYHRWASPKFIIGESYGSTRAAGLAEHLQDAFGMYLNGVMMISTVLNFQTIAFDPGNDLPYVLFLPAYAAGAWYHGRLKDLQSKSLLELLRDVETFAERDYATALMKGASLNSTTRDKVVRDLHRYTGLSTESIERVDLRIPMTRFAKLLLQNSKRIIGRFDARITGVDPDIAGDSYSYDPSYTTFYGISSTTLNHYVRTELEFQSDLPYEVLTGRVHPWDYGRFRNRYLDLTGSLVRAMTMNPHLNIFVASGYYDLATPYFATDYTFNHLSIDSSLRENIHFGYYEAGHMMYYHLPSLEKLKLDLASFIAQAVN